MKIKACPDILLQLTKYRLPFGLQWSLEKIPEKEHIVSMSDDRNIQHLRIPGYIRNPTHGFYRNHVTCTTVCVKSKIYLLMWNWKLHEMENSCLVAVLYIRFIEPHQFQGFHLFLWSSNNKELITSNISIRKVSCSRLKQTWVISPDWQGK